MKYRVGLRFPDGNEVECEEDEIFDTEEEANEFGLYLLSCARTGNEMFHLSNPGDYSLNDESTYNDVDIYIIEIDD